MVFRDFVCLPPSRWDHPFRSLVHLLGAACWRLRAQVAWPCMVARGAWGCLLTQQAEVGSNLEPAPSHSEAKSAECFGICAVWMEKYWDYCKNKTESQRQEAWIQNFREPLIPGNINRQELIQNPPYLHQNQAPPTIQQDPGQDIPC